MLDDGGDDGWEAGWDEVSEEPADGEGPVFVESVVGEPEGKTAGAGDEDDHNRRKLPTKDREPVPAGAEDERARLMVGAVDAAVGRCTGENK